MYSGKRIHQCDASMGEVGVYEGSKGGYFTGSSLMVQCRLALGTDGQEMQVAVTFSPTA